LLNTLHQLLKVTSKKINSTKKNMKTLTYLRNKCTPNWEVRPVLIFGVLLVLLFFTACSKDEAIAGTEPPEDSGQGELIEESGIDESELTTFMGEIGIYLDVRAYIKKGYAITKVQIIPTDSDFFEPLIVEVNEYTNYAILKLAVADLSEEAVLDLRDGINLDVVLLDDLNEEKFRVPLEKVIFNNANEAVVLFAEEAEDLNTTVYLNPATPYFLQLITKDGEIESKALDTKPNLTFGGTLRTSGTICDDVIARYSLNPSLNTEADFAPDNKTQQFYFQQVEGEENVFSIRSADTNTYLVQNNFGNDNIEIFNSPITPDNSDFENLGDRVKFRVKKENGAFQLLPYDSDTPLRFFITDDRICYNGGDLFEQFPDSYSRTVLTTRGGGKGQNFRIVASDVEYSSEDISTWYGQPVLPAATNALKINSTLKNCGSRDLSQTVGSQISETTVMSLSWEKTNGFVTSTRLNTTVSVEAEVSASFFGTGAKVTGSVSQEIELGQEISESSTDVVGEQSETSKSLFAERTVIVPPGRQVLTYDAIQSYANITVPFVQRIKITGKNSESRILSGEELATQSAFGGFTGTITEIGGTFIEITVRGTATFDQAVDATTSVFESDAVCD
jgi:hypothetical protein